MPHPSSNGATLATYLEHLATQGRAHGVYVHPQPLTFADGAMKANWRDAFTAADNLQGRGLYSEFLRAPKGGCAVWVALFSTVEANWVKGEPWQQTPLHCWAVALIPRADGQPRRALLLYNVDPIRPDPAQLSEPRALERTRTYLSGTQNRFLERCRKDKVVDEIVWHNADPQYVGRGECLQRSLEWIQLMIAVGGQLFTGADDPRVRGFRTCRFR
ncbi:hypothetical protein ATERTT37_002425 [Aspergillus terreus]